MNDTERKEKELLYSLIAYRLNEDKAIIEAEMKKREPLDTSHQVNPIVRANNRLMNRFRKNDTDTLSEDKKHIQDQLDQMEELLEKESLTLIPDSEELKEALNLFFQDDTYGLARISFGLQYVLSKDYHYVHEEETLSLASKVLFDDENRMKNLYAELKDNYLMVYKKPLGNVEKSILIALGATSILSLTLVPAGLAMGAIASTSFAASLAAIGEGGTVALGILSVSLTSLVTSSFLLGAAYGITKIISIEDRERLKKEFRKLTPEDLGLLIAIRLTLIEESKKVMSEKDYQEALDDTLRMIDDFRSDAEYMLIIQKLDAKNAKKKIDSCNLTTRRLSEIEGI